MRKALAEANPIIQRMPAGCRYSLRAACTIMRTSEQLQDGLRRTVQAEEGSLAAATVCLGAAELPEAGTPVAELCQPGSDVLNARILTPPACCSDMCAGTQLYTQPLEVQCTCIIPN